MKLEKWRPLTIFLRHLAIPKLKKKKKCSLKTAYCSQVTEKLPKLIPYSVAYSVAYWSKDIHDTFSVLIMTFY